MPDGTAVQKYILSAGAYTLELTSLGAAIVGITVPDKTGNPRQVVAGFSSAEEYLGMSGCYGAVVGRVANRIKGAAFGLDGKTYRLTPNEGENALHSGEANFSYRVWDAEIIDGAAPAVCFSLCSPDGDGGFPGNLRVSATYSLTDRGDISLQMTADTDKPTVVNLTNHAYFNLSGVGSGAVLDHRLMLHADCITESDTALIPTGRIVPVDGTPYDFRDGKTIGEGLRYADAQLSSLGGFDHNYLLPRADGIREAAAVSSPESGISMRLLTNQPCVQFYTVYSERKKLPYAGGEVPTRLDTFCLEAQAMPDAVHHPDICDITLRPGERYDKTVIFSFSVRD